MSKNRINSEMKRIKKKIMNSERTQIISTQHSTAVISFVRSLRSQTMLILFLASSSRARGKLFLFQIWCVAGVCLFIATVRFSFVFVHEMSNFVIYQYADSRSYIRWSYYINRLAEVRHKTTLDRFGKFQTAVCCGVIRFCYIFKFFLSLHLLIFLRILDALHVVFYNAVSAR